MTPTILAIDDEPEILDFYSEILTAAGYCVATALNGLEGCQKIQSLRPDLVITDWAMPVMDGSGVLDKLKSHPEHAATYVIVVTGVDDSTTKLRGFEAGADDYLMKPFEKLELLARVRVGLRVRRMQESLTQEVRILSQAIEQSPVSIIITDTEGNIEYLNPRYTQMTGFTADDIVGQNAGDIRPVEGSGARLVEWSVLDFVREGKEFRGELCSYRKNGGVLWERMHASSIKNTEGNVSHYLFIREDITEQKKEEGARRTGEDRFRSIAESTHDAIIVADHIGDITVWNRGVESIFGYTENEILGKPLTAIVPKQYHAAHRKGMKRFMRTGEPTILGNPTEMSAVRKNGSEFPVELSLSTWDSDGKKYFAAIIRDITRRKLVEESTRREKARFEQLFEKAPVGIVLMDSEDTIISVNPGFEKMFQFGSSQLIGCKLANAIVPENLTNESVWLSSMTSPEHSTFKETVRRRKDGVLIPVEVYGFPIFVDGEIIGIYGMYVDISERKANEAALATSEKEFRSIWDASFDGMRIIDAQGTILKVNPAFCRLVGRTKEELIGKHYSDVYAIEHGERLLAKFEGKVNLESVQPYVEREVTLWNGRHVWFELSNSVLSVDGQPDLLLSIFRDSTERRKAQEEMNRSSQRLHEIIGCVEEGITLSDRSGHFEIFNSKMEALTGYTIEEANATKDFSSLLFPGAAEHQKALDGLLVLLQTGQPHEVEATIRAKDGSEKILLISSSLVTIQTQEYFLSVYKDITERKETDKKMQILSRAVHQSPASIVITDTTGKIEYVNPKFCKLTGYSEQEAIGQNPRVLKSGEMSSVQYDDLWKTLLAGNEWQGMFHNKKKNGQLYWENAIISPVKNAEGVTTHYLAVKEDISELLKEEELRKKAERELLARNGELEMIVFDLKRMQSKLDEPEKKVLVE